MRMRLFGSTAFTVTRMDKSYIAHSHVTTLWGSSRPLPLVNQNFDVIDGSTNASKTSSTGLRMSISAFATGAAVS